MQSCEKETYFFCVTGWRAEWAEGNTGCWVWEKNLFLEQQRTGEDKSAAETCSQIIVITEWGLFQLKNYAIYCTHTTYCNPTDVCLKLKYQITGNS